MRIRQANNEDFPQIEWLTREAFWNHMGKGCDEHYIVHQTRKLPCYNRNLTFVAEVNDKIVGYIALYDAQLHHKDSTDDILTICPVAVHPYKQNKGIGSGLIKHAFDKAKELNYGAVIIFGDPNFYERFGFKNAMHFNITTEDGHNFDEFLALELTDDYLKDKSGFFKELHEVELKKEDMLDYEKQLLSQVPF